MTLVRSLLIAIILYQRGIVMGEGEVIDEGFTTNWYQMPSVGISGRPYSTELGKKIRDIFKDPEQVIDGDLRKQMSPSFMLAGEETGKDTFLDKKTIKHSILDLSNLSKAKRVRGDEILSCGAMQVGVKLYFPTCPGDLVVITIAGSLKMTCNEIEKRIFYGPVTIKSNKCQQSFVFDIECQKKNALRINSTVCDDSNFKIAFVLTMSILVLVLTALLILLLWVIGLQRGILIKGRKVKLQREGCYYTVHYSEYINENGEKEFMLGSEPSIVNMEHKVVRKHWCLLLLLFLICKPLKVTGYELMESYDSTKLKYNYKIVLGDSEQINFGSGTITREVVIHTSNLAHLFDTASWKLNIKEEYFCQWYKCEALSVCGMGTLPFIQVGDLAKELFGFKLSERAFYTCQKLIGYCTFGNGCKLIAFEVVPDTTSKRSVYSMTAGGSHGGEVKPPVGCIVDSVIDKSAGLLESHLLVTGENNESYICNRDLFSAKPEMGMLGDLQLMREGRMHFATREIGCVADYNNRAICRYGGSFIENIDSHCEKTSHLPFKVDVNTLDHTFSWKMSGEAVVSLRCDRRIPLRQTTGVCTDIEVKVWEVAHLDSQLLLGFVANSLNGESVFKFPKLVHMHSHSFTCDSIQQYSELYDLKSLKTLGINYTLETIPFNSLDALQEDHFSNSDPEIDRGVTIVERVINNLPFWGLSSTALIVLLAIAILCMMRR